MCVGVLRRARPPVSVAPGRAGPWTSAGLRRQCPHRPAPRCSCGGRRADRRGKRRAGGDDGAPGWQQRQHRVALAGQTAPMDTPIFDGVLGDRLAQAREAVQLAEHDSRAFAAALAQGQAQALEQLAQARAEALARERTAALTAQVAVLQSELERLRGDTQTRTEVVRPPSPPAGTAAGQAGQAPPPDPAAPATPAASPDPAAVATPAVPPATPVAPPARVVVAPDAAAVTVAAGGGRMHRSDGTVRAGRPTTVRTGRLAADAGPTGDDVPSVPSMKDLFASTRAAGWLDQLMGAKR